MTRDHDHPALKLVFDASLCDGHGMCTLVFPHRITLDPWGYAVADPEPISDRRMLRRARAAVGCCPAGALSLTSGPAPKGASPLSERSPQATVDGQPGGRE